MPSFNFKARFADQIRSGTKRQTIRQRGKRPPPKVGDIAYLFTGLRTQHVSRLGEHPITEVTPISISTAQRIVSGQRLMVGAPVWAELSGDEVEQLARDDGFANADEFFQFFATEYGRTFSGHLIKW